MASEVDAPTREDKQRWIQRCAIRYFTAFWIGWTVTAILGRPGQDPHHPDAFMEMSRWDSFKDYLSLGPGMFLMIAVPSLIILMVMGYRGQKLAAEQFRVMTGFFLMIPLWFLPFAGGGIILVTQAVVQGSFAAVMPGPLAPKQD